jgi:hypothetical protein
VALNPTFHRHHHMLIVIRWSLTTSLMRPMRVAVIGILVQDHAQVTFAVDQHAVGALGAHRPDPARHSSSPSGVRGGVFSTVMPTAANTSSKTVVNLASRSRMRKRNDPCPLAEVDQDIAGLLNSPCAGRMGGHAKDMNVSRADLHHEQHVQALEKDRVNMEEVAG